MNDQPPSGNVTGLIDRVLRFIDRPWKAVTVIVLLILCGVGWFVYDKRNELFEAWLTPSSPELKTADVPEALDKLIVETDADIVQIWAVDLGSNLQRFLGARLHSGERPVIPSPRRLPIIVHTSDVKALIEVMEGAPSCVDLSQAGSPIARRMEARGMKRGCAIPISPGPESFVGVIYLGPVEAHRQAERRRGSRCSARDRTQAGNALRRTDAERENHIRFVPICSRHALRSSIIFAAIRAC